MSKQHLDCRETAEQFEDLCVSLCFVTVSQPCLQLLADKKRQTFSKGTVCPACSVMLFDELLNYILLFKVVVATLTAPIIAGSSYISHRKPFTAAKLNRY